MDRLFLQRYRIRDFERRERWVTSNLEGLLFYYYESDKFKFDTDLVKNSSSGLETLLRVGQSIGHSPDVEEYKRDHISFDKLDKSKQLRLIRVLTGGDLKDKHKLSNWEAIKIDMEDFQEIEDEEIFDKDIPDEDASIKSED